MIRTAEMCHTTKCFGGLWGLQTEHAGQDCYLKYPEVGQNVLFLFLLQKILHSIDHYANKLLTKRHSLCYNNPV